MCTSLYGEAANTLLVEDVDHVCKTREFEMITSSPQDSTIQIRITLFIKMIHEFSVTELYK